MIDDAHGTPGRNAEPKVETARERAGRKARKQVALGCLGFFGIMLLLLAIDQLREQFPEMRYGDRLEFNGGEVFRTSTITGAEATRLGEYFVDSGYFDGEKKRVQVERRNHWTVEVRVVVKKRTAMLEDRVLFFKDKADEISRRVFFSEPTEIHLCDDRLNSFYVIRQTAAR